MRCGRFVYRALGGLALCGTPDSGRQEFGKRPVRADKHSGAAVTKEKEEVMRRRCVGFTMVALWFSTAQAFSQGFLAVDQASGTTNELLQVFTMIPNNQISQSFTPVIPAVGFVQLQTVIFANNSGETLLINLRQGAYNGPI